MKILVLNGSPAGKNSITLQTVEYMKVIFPEHDYTVLNVAQRIRSIEKDFSDSMTEMEDADLILFCYPVYTFLVPAQLYRFIELMKESGSDLSGKYATQISTSKHFYDTTAHRFIEDTCADLKLRYIRGLSADMEDLLTDKGRLQARAFFRFLFWNIKNGQCETPSVIHSAPASDFCPVMASDAASDEKTGMKKDRSQKGGGREDGLHVAIVADYDPETPAKALTAMIRRFEQRFPGTAETINLREFPFKGGCLGCFHCATDGKCIYNDGFDDYLRGHINSADAVVYAFTIKDHAMGYRMKLYDDRQFCNGHRTVTMGKPVGYLIDGHLAQEENLKVLIEARAQVGGNFLAGAATDEVNPDREIDQMTRRLVYASVHHYTQPQNFYGVGGMKIFRDLIFEMQGLMKEDHRFYKEHGFYDFPQKKKSRIALMYLVSLMMNSKKLQKKLKVSMTDGMLLPYKKVIEKAGEEQQRRHR